MYRIGHDGKGIGAGWHLNEVIIECEEMNKKWTFSCNRWLDRKEDDGKLEVELVGVASDIQLVDRTEYLVEVYTGDEKMSGTDSNVFLTMIGEDGESSEKHLAESETNFNKFERNHVDRFKFVDKNFGKLFGIKIRHDNSGALSEWFLDRVEITDRREKQKFIFVCQKWFSLYKDDKRIERVIKEEVWQVRFVRNVYLFVDICVCVRL